jgi:hypothetical protein
MSIPGPQTKSLTARTPCTVEPPAVSAADDGLSFADQPRLHRL